MCHATSDAPAPRRTSREYCRRVLRRICMGNHQHAVLGMLVCLQSYAVMHHACHTAPACTLTRRSSANNMPFCLLALSMPVFMRTVVSQELHRCCQPGASYLGGKRHRARAAAPPLSGRRTRRIRGLENRPRAQLPRARRLRTCSTPQTCLVSPSPLCAVLSSPCGV